MDLMAVGLLVGVSHANAVGWFSALSLDFV